MMKKLLVLFSFFSLLAACSKDANVATSSQDGGGDIVNFSASMRSINVSKAAEAKTTWKDGDQIAIFVDGDNSTIYCYDINSTGVMSPAEGVEAFQIMDTDLTEVTYLAFYPYNAALESLAEYQAATSTEVDIMSSIATGNDLVEFTFSHDAVLLYFNFLTEGEITSPTITIGEVSYSLEFSYSDNAASASIFVEPIEDITLALLTMVVDSKKYYFNLSSEDITSWNEGCSYNYSEISLEQSTDSGSGSDI